MTWRATDGRKHEANGPELNPGAMKEGKSVPERKCVKQRGKDGTESDREAQRGVQSEATAGNNLAAGRAHNLLAVDPQDCTQGLCRAL